MHSSAHTTPDAPVEPTQSPKPPRSVLAAVWIWWVGSIVTVVGMLVGVAMEPVPVLFIALAVTIVQAAVAIPAANVVRRGGRNWARIALIVLAAFSLGSLYQSLQMGAWPSLVLNVVLGATLAMLTTTEAKQHCRRGTGDEQSTR